MDGREIAQPVNLLEFCADALCVVNRVCVQTSLESPNAAKMLYIDCFFPSIPYSHLYYIENSLGINLVR